MRAPAFMRAPFDKATRLPSSLPSRTCASPTKSKGQVSEFGIVLSDSGHLPSIFNNLVAMFASPSLAPPMELVKQNVSPRGEGTAKPRVRGCRLRAKSANPSPTRRGGSPLSRKRARVVVNRFFPRPKCTSSSRRPKGAPALYCQPGCRTPRANQQSSMVEWPWDY